MLTGGVVGEQPSGGAVHQLESSGGTLLNGGGQAKLAGYQEGSGGGHHDLLGAQQAAEEGEGQKAGRWVLGRSGGNRAKGQVEVVESIMLPGQAGSYDPGRHNQVGSRKTNSKLFVV